MRLNKRVDSIRGKKYIRRCVCVRNEGDITGELNGMPDAFSKHWSFFPYA